MLLLSISLLAIWAQIVYNKRTSAYFVLKFAVLGGALAVPCNLQSATGGLIPKLRVRLAGSEPEKRC